METHWHLTSPIVHKLRFQKLHNSTLCLYLFYLFAGLSVCIILAMSSFSGTLVHLHDASNF